VAELADATALGAVGREAVEVRVLSTAPNLHQLLCLGPDLTVRCASTTTDSASAIP
jgi:hypothetical protein